MTPPRTVQTGGFAGPRVRRLAYVVTVGAGAVGLDLVAQARGFDPMAKHRLRRGGAADISGTDKQDAHGDRPLSDMALAVGI